jgi:hypothetical protein
MEYIVKHCLFAGFSLLLSAFFFIQSSAMPTQAALFPKIIAAMVALFSVLMITNAAKDAGTMGKSVNVNEEQNEEGKINVLRVIVFMTLVVAYVYLIPKAGYFVMTPLFMLATYGYLRAMGPVKAVLISLVFSVFIYGLFVCFLNLPIPMGYLEPFLGF